MQKCLKLFFEDDKKKKKISVQDINLNMFAIIAFFESFDIMSGVDSIKINEESKHDTQVLRLQLKELNADKNMIVDPHHQNL